MGLKDEEHWNDVYEIKKYSEVTWFQTKPSVSLDLIKKLNLEKSGLILDVGAGSSNLVDCLVGDGYQNIYLLDLAKSAFDQTKNRLGDCCNSVHWLRGDVRTFDFKLRYDLWHDRAVFHFFTEIDDQQQYLSNLNKTLKKNGNLILSTFAEDGPLKCSGLEVARYHRDELVEKVGQDFQLLDFLKETHTSPGGTEQKFNYWMFEKIK